MPTTSQGAWEFPRPGSTRQLAAACCPPSSVGATGVSTTATLIAGLRNSVRQRGPPRKGVPMIDPSTAAFLQPRQRARSALRRLIARIRQDLLTRWAVLRGGQALCSQSRQLAPELSVQD